MTSTQKTIAGATVETWVKIMAPLLVVAIGAALIWASRVEGRSSHFATTDDVRAAIKEHLASGPHPGAARRADFEALRRRMELQEVRASRTDAKLEAIQAGIDEIKRDLRQMRRRKQ